MEEALSEQMRERQEMERKLQKLSKTMDHLERAKREEERSLIEEAYRKRLQDDEKFYQEQQEVCLFDWRRAELANQFLFHFC
jgi:translation initiation factor 3 subunit A